MEERRRKSTGAKRMKKSSTTSVKTRSKLPDDQRIKTRAKEQEKLRKKKRKTSKKRVSERPVAQKTNRTSKNNQIKNREKVVRAEKPISIFSWFLWLMQLITSGIFVATLVWLDIFPTKYLIALGIILFVILLIALFFYRHAAKKGRLQIMGKLISIGMIAAAVIGSYYVFVASSAIDKMSAQVGDRTNANNIDVTEESFNVYVSGIDVYGDIDQKSRSDVNIIATVNPKTHKILLTTTPRDYYVPIPGVSGDARDKLTHAGLYGIETSMATLENLYGIEIPFYVRVNFTSVIQIVDMFGGVDVESEYAFTTSKAAGKVVDIKKGMNHLNGEEALAFVRERKALEDGDNQRGRDQEALLTALIGKLVSPTIIYKANSLIGCVAGNANTNLTEKQMKSLIRMQLDDLQGWDVESVSANGENASREWCYSYSGNTLYVALVDEASVAEISEKIRQVLSGK